MRVEIEVDVPEGWKPTGEFRQARKGDTYLSTKGRFIWTDCAHTSSEKYIILRKVEPKRESRWTNLYQHTSGMLCRSRDECTDALSGERVSLIRIDYEDGKPVAVTLEPEGEEA